MLLNKQESLLAIFLKASENEDDVVDVVSSVGFYLFFVALGVWSDGMKPCILCVDHMYEKASTHFSRFRSTKGMGELWEGRK
jgi:hypothetical protein